MDREQIIKALECCGEYTHGTTCNNCPYMQIELADNEICSNRMSLDALSLIKELIEENKAWQERLISQEEKAGKTYYDLACEVEDLKAIAEQYQKQFEDCAEDRSKLTEENERLRAENEVLETNVKDLRGRNNGLQRANESLAKDCDILEDELNECVQIKADTVRKMQERLKERFSIETRYTKYSGAGVVMVIDQIANEFLKEKEK